MRTITFTAVLKIDKNRCKQTLASIPCFLGLHVVSVYSYKEPTTKMHMHVVVNMSSLPTVYKNIELPHYYPSLRYQ